MLDGSALVLPLEADGDGEQQAIGLGHLLGDAGANEGGGDGEVRGLKLGVQGAGDGIDREDHAPHEAVGVVGPRREPVALEAREQEAREGLARRVISGVLVVEREEVLTGLEGRES